MGGEGRDAAQDANGLIEVVGGGRQDEDGDEGPVGERPEVVPEGKAEDVETDVAPEYGVEDAEGKPLAEEDVLVPLAGRADADGVGHDEREEGQREVEIADGEVLHHLGYPLPEGALFVVPGGAMGEAAGDLDIGDHDHEEDGAEGEAEAELGGEDLPEDVGEADVEIEPEPLGVDVQQPGEPPDDGENEACQERPADHATPEASPSEIRAHYPHPHPPLSSTAAC